MIFRLLYKAFPKAYAAAMPTANFPDYKGQMELVFQHDGHGYYKFTRAQDIPNIRYLRLQQHIQEHQARLSEADLNVFVELLDKAYADLLSPREATQVQAKKEIGYIIDEMKFRHKELPVHVRVLADIAAVTLIRDDENPAEIDEAIHNAKVAVLQGQIKDEGFFLKVGLAELIPNFEQLASHWNKLAEIAERMLTESDTRLQDFKTLKSGGGFFAKNRSTKNSSTS